MNFQERYGRYAIVAGASSGLGAAFARELAERKLDLLLLARRKELLESLAAELGAAHGVDVRVAAVDLGAPDLLAQVRDAAAGLDVGLVVYNAAHSHIGPFLEQPLEDKLRIVDVNCRGPLVLADEFGRRMAARGRGGFVFMASMAAAQGSPLVATYAATKAFDLVLAEGLWYELRDHGVDVVAIRPGSTRTPGWQSSQPADGDLRGVMEPADVVRDALAALGTTPSIAAGAANRAAEAAFRGMARRDVIELMSSITAQLVTPEPPGT